MCSVYYRVYGLWLSSSRLIPALIPIEKNPSPAVTVSFEGLPSWFGGSFLKECQATLVEKFATLYRVGTDLYWHFCYANHSEYLVKNDGREIWVSWREPVTLAEVCVYLLGPVFARVLQLQGRTPLHASTVVIDGLAVAFLGPSKAGKSTIAAKFAQLGYTVLVEDVLNLLPDENEFKAAPGYPVIRLWPQSMDILHGVAGTSTDGMPGQDKLCLDSRLGTYHFEGEPRPLAAIYVLKERADDERAPYIETLEPHMALLELLANTLGQSIIDAQGRARNFVFLDRLAKAAPIRKMVPHCSPDRLERMCELIAEDFRKQVAPRWKMRVETHV